MNYRLISVSTVAGVVCLGALCTVPDAPGFAQASSADQTLVRVNMVNGYVTLYVNGQSVGRVGKANVLSGGGAGIKEISISRYVKPGPNKLRIVWSEQRVPNGTIAVGYAPGGSAMRALASVKLDVVSAKASGERTVTFNVPRSGTNQSVAADKAPSGTVAPGSHANQTLLSANIANGATGTVFINDKKAGTFTGAYVPIDISDYVRVGENALRLEWQGKTAPAGSVSVSYAAQASKFRTLNTFALNPLSTRGNNKFTGSFTVPASK